MIQYQDKLYNLLDNLTLDTFPHTLLLLGERGCGKHTFIQDIGKKLSLEVVNITDRLSAEFIVECYLQPVPYIYVIDLNNVKLKEQNALLKFIEEPIETSYIVCTLELKSQTLPTILNRCQCWEFERYNVEQLKSFTNDELLLQICTTPGQILTAQKYNVNEIKGYCEHIINKIHTASIPNILYILPNKLAYNNEQDKFDIHIFIRLLLLGLRQAVIDGKPFYDAYYLTDQLFNDLYIPNISVQQLFEHYFLELYMVMKKIWA